MEYSWKEGSLCGTQKPESEPLQHRGERATKGKSGPALRLGTSFGAAGSHQLPLRAEAKAISFFSLAVGADFRGCRKRQSPRLTCGSQIRLRPFGSSGGQKRMRSPTPTLPRAPRVVDALARASPWMRCGCEWRAAAQESVPCVLGQWGSVWGGTPEERGAPPHAPSLVDIGSVSHSPAGPGLGHGGRERAGVPEGLLRSASFGTGCDAGPRAACAAPGRLPTPGSKPQFPPLCKGSVKQTW